MSTLQIKDLQKIDCVQLTGPFDAELLSALPASLKYICHNGAGYDNIDVAGCTQKGKRHLPGTTV